MVQDKTQFAGNGNSLGKNCNAVLNHLWASLRAWRETVIYGVRFLAKGTTIRYETCLVANGFSSRLIVKLHGTLH
ncbi:hypothetical protein BMS3Abin11_02480 [bacterium BMS3Abin11]|nr:hypothetical protein BMS3Abin11_02480 [bacterium BMS3Abin11]